MRFFAPVLFIRLLFQTKYMASYGKMAYYQRCVLDIVHNPARTADRFSTHKFVNLLCSNLSYSLIDFDDLNSILFVLDLT